MCSILQSSYRFDLAGLATRHRRSEYTLPDQLSLGNAIYSSRYSSQARYHVQDHAEAQYNTMLLNDVVVGRTYRTKNVEDALPGRPKGYDSVTACFDATCEDIAVYSEEAIIPTHLVVYKKPHSIFKTQAVHHEEEGGKRWGRRRGVNCASKWGTGQGDEGFPGAVETTRSLWD